MNIVRSFPMDDFITGILQRQAIANCIKHSTEQTVLTLYFDSDVTATKMAIDISYDLLIKMSPSDITHNEEKVASALGRFWYDIPHGKALLKKTCLERKKNVGMVFYYIDREVSRRIYIVFGGYLSPLSSKMRVRLSDLVDREDMTDADFEEDEKFTVPAFQLPTLSPEPEPSVIAISRMAAIVGALFVILNEAEEMGKPVLPCGDSFYEFEPALGYVMPSEERSAIRLLIASVCREQQVVLTIARDYKKMILACDLVDTTFFARVVAANPEYSSCRSITQLGDRCHNTIVTMARHYGTIHNEMPVALRAFLFVV